MRMQTAKRAGGLALWLVLAAGVGGAGLGGCDSGSTSGNGFFPADGVSGADVAGGDTATGGDASLLPGSLTSCIASAQCAVDLCRNNWSANCGAPCANATASAAAATASALLACTTQQCVLGDCAGSQPPTQACMDACTAQKCPTELFACWEQGNSPGSDGCGSIAACLPGCDNDPKRFTCQATCYGKASAGAQSQFKATSLCLSQNPTAPAQCADESLTCLADGKTGQDSCYAVQSCLSKCAESDSACQGSCFGKGSATAQSQLLALLECAAGSNPESCLPQTIACATPSGNANCLDTAQCVGGCPGGDAQGTCALDCLNKATPGGANAFAKLAPCIQKNCPDCQGNDCQSCATSKCFSEALTCSTN